MCVDSETYQETEVSSLLAWMCSGFIHFRDNRATLNQKYFGKLRQLRHRSCAGGPAKSGAAGFQPAAHQCSSSAALRHVRPLPATIKRLLHRCERTLSMHLWDAFNHIGLSLIEELHLSSYIARAGRHKPPRHSPWSQH